MPPRVISGISFGFPELSQSQGQVAHVLLTRSPLLHPRRGFTVRLACVKHAASVRPEPGSNSPLMSVSASPRWGRHLEPVRVDRLIWHEQTYRVHLPIPKESSWRSRPDKPDRANHGRGFLASTFGTLLSSQGADAHRHHAFRQDCRGNPSTLDPRDIPVNQMIFPGMPLWVPPRDADHIAAVESHSGSRHRDRPHVVSVAPSEATGCHLRQPGASQSNRFRIGPDLG